MLPRVSELGAAPMEITQRCTLCNLNRCPRVLTPAPPACARSCDDSQWCRTLMKRIQSIRLSQYIGNKIMASCKRLKFWNYYKKRITSSHILGNNRDCQCGLLVWHISDKRLLGRPRLLTGISNLRSVSAVFQNPHSLNKHTVRGREWRSTGYLIPYC